MTRGTTGPQHATSAFQPTIQAKPTWYNSLVDKVTADDNKPAKRHGGGLVVCDIERH